MKITTLVLILISSLFLIGCTNNNQTQKEEIMQIMKENEYVMIDVRTKEEYDTSHIQDAINIPYNEIDETINIDKTKVVLVYCQSGNRSKMAYNTLTSLGYQTYDLGAMSQIDLPKE